MIASWLQDAVSQFGRQVGLHPLALDDSGAAHIELQAGGFLSIEVARSGRTDVLVSMARPLGFGAARLQRALESAHFASGNPFDLRVAVRVNGHEPFLCGVVSVPQRELTGQVLERVVEYLRRWFGEVGHV